MGFKINYLAARLSPEDMTASLGLTMLGSVDAYPDNLSWIAPSAKTGWTLVCLEGDRFIEQYTDKIQDLSHKSDVIACRVHEGTMWSSAAYWHGGKSLWHVSHAGDADIMNLKAEGALPPAFEEIKAKHLAAPEADDEVDTMFEVPLDLAATFVQFRHDDAPADGLFDRYRIVEQPKPKGLLSKLFG